MWQLNLAPEKCSVLKISLTKPPLNPERRFYILNGRQINECSYIRDLGVLIDNRLNFGEHISNTKRTALIRAKLILKCFQSRNKELLIKAFITYVRPLLEYCSPVWSPHHLYLRDKIEDVQRYFTKRIPGLWNVPYNRRLDILGLHPLYVKRAILDLALLY